MSNIEMNDLYEKRYKRIQYIIDYLNSKSPYSILEAPPNYCDSLQYHKNNITHDNPLQILTAEGLFLLKKIKEQKKEFIKNNESKLDSSWIKV